MHLLDKFRGFPLVVLDEMKGKMVEPAVELQGRGAEDGGRSQGYQKFDEGVAFVGVVGPQGFVFQRVFELTHGMSLRSFTGRTASV